MTTTVSPSTPAPTRPGDSPSRMKPLDHQRSVSPHPSSPLPRDSSQDTQCLCVSQSLFIWCLKMQLQKTLDKTIDSKSLFLVSNILYPSVSGVPCDNVKLCSVVIFLFGVKLFYLSICNVSPRCCCSSSANNNFCNNLLNYFCRVKCWSITLKQ